MAYISYEFLLFFLPIVFLIYNLFRKNMKAQNVILLVASMFFYACYDIKYIVLLLICIIITFIGGNVGVLTRDDRKASVIYTVTLIMNFSMLIIFKYTNFIIGNINVLLNKIGYVIELPQLLLPVGLSFFIFQSSTYILDLWLKKRNEPEKSIIRYGLFVSFFPSITSGPIQRSFNLLPQIEKRNDIDWKGAQEALFGFLWGAFLKLVIADRLALFVNAVYANYIDYSGLIIIICAFAYSIQIYADFSGYSHMAINVAKLFGFKLKDNFRQPYFACTIADFWRRWHISLTSWFTDYVYIPLGGNRKGELRKYVNISIVFLISGLWHGASWNFIIWGAIHGAYQIIGYLTKNIRQKVVSIMKVDKNQLGYKILQKIFIFNIVSFAWIFFRAESFSSAIMFIKQGFSWNPWVLFDGTLFNIGLNEIEWLILLIATIVMFIVSWCREHGVTINNMASQNVVIKVIIFWLLIFSIIILGIYGGEYSADSFIYAGF